MEKKKSGLRPHRRRGDRQRIVARRHGARDARGPSVRRRMGLHARSGGGAGGLLGFGLRDLCFPDVSRLDALPRDAPRLASRRVFHVLDHIFIYVAIAGSYTPIALSVIGGWQGLLIAGLQWAMVVFGIFYKSLSHRSIPAVSLTIYLVMGWAILLFPSAVRPPRFDGAAGAHRPRRRALYARGGDLCLQGVPLSPSGVASADRPGGGGPLHGNRFSFSVSACTPRRCGRPAGRRACVPLRKARRRSRCPRSRIRFAQPVGIVRAVDAPVVVLAEDARALVGIGDRIVFEGAFVIAFHGREDDAPTRRGAGWCRLAQGRGGRRPRVPAGGCRGPDVHRIVGERNPLHVEMQVRERAFEIGRDVPAGPGREVGVSGGA